MKATLQCPIRGPLQAAALAKDGLTETEEVRRIDFLNFLLHERHYPPDNVTVETVILKNLGHDGKKNLRADVIVYDKPKKHYSGIPLEDRWPHILLVAEIKRDARNKQKGIERQLEPALRILPRIDTIGVYWDDQQQELFVKRLTEKPAQQLEVHTDNIANLPYWGQQYQAELITVDRLIQPSNLVKTLFELANVMRSHNVNDEALRYRETVKLLLARYVDERASRATTDKILRLQVHPGGDPGFMERVQRVYQESATRYSQARTLFNPTKESELEERVLRGLVESIQGFNLSSASSETIQQVFMSFVPVVFKKSLSQYFTPISLIEAVVSMVDIGPNDKIADPAMGTADFLTVAMASRPDDDDITSRVHGIDSDEKAHDLAVINMYLNRDGHAQLVCDDSIRDPSRWAEAMTVVLCNPPFGSKTLEKDNSVLMNYELGHEWEQKEDGSWEMTSNVLRSQQLGILFIERCWKLLCDGGRLGIIWPEGYLATAAYGYAREWILNRFRILALVELPRRIFTKSEADLRSNVLILQKVPEPPSDNYPIFASLIRKVGYKLGGDFSRTPLHDSESGVVVRDEHNKEKPDSDFVRMLKDYEEFNATRPDRWKGARRSDIVERRDLDMKPRRLMPRALANVLSIQSVEHVRLGEIAEVVEDTVNLLDDPSDLRRPVEGQHIRAVEGIVSPGVPERCWSIAKRKASRVYALRSGDIVVGLVRPERRNVGVLLEDGDDIVGMKDALAVVRIKPEYAEEYPQTWLFTALRSEATRIQFWTESGGTSYGKLRLDQIRDVLLRSEASSREVLAEAASQWMTAVKSVNELWPNVGAEEDRQPILNSPLVGLVETEG